MTSTNELKKNLALILGEDENKIQAISPAWVRLMKEGVLVSLHIGRWRAKTRLTWRDLGIALDRNSDRELQQIVNLGHKKLLPARLLKRLDSIESKSRKLLEKKAYRTHWGFFIPATSYAEFKEELDVLKDQYFALRDEIVKDYDFIRQEVLLGYEIAARGSYDRLKALSPSSLKSFKNEDDFVKNFVNRIDSYIESSETISESFKFCIDLNYVPLPSLLAADKAMADEITRKEQVAYERLQEQREIERQRAWAEQEEIQASVRATKTAAEKREEMLAAMNQDVIDQTRAQKEQLVDGFLKDVVSQLRNLVYTATTDVLGAIRDKGKLHPRSVVQLKNMVEQVQSLNFYGDEDIDKMMSVVTFELSATGDERNIDQIQERLADIATLTRSSLLSLGETPRHSRELNLLIGDSNEQDEACIREARENLNLGEKPQRPEWYQEDEQEEEQEARPVVRTARKSLNLADEITVGGLSRINR